MLVELLASGYGEKEDLNCAEKILYGSNEVYGLGLDREALKMAAGFGGGMAMEDKCGALTAGIMVLSKLFVKEVAHESTRIKELTRELFHRYEDLMGHIDCTPLKEKYRKDEDGCKYVIIKAAEVLDSIVKRELNIG